MTPTHLTEAQKKRNGAFYTPAPLARRLLATALSFTPLDHRRTMRILDPACGDGAFLVAALNDLLAAGAPGRAELLRRAAENLYGCDTDPEAVRRCRDNLIAAAGSAAAGLGSGEEAKLRQALAARVTCCDTLARDDVNRYDLVIGNPPFISADDIEPARKELLRRLYPRTARHRFDLCCLFFEHAIGHLVEGGVLALIGPARALTGRYFRPLRQMLLSRTKLLAVADLGESRMRVSNPIGFIVARRESPGGDYDLADASADDGSVRTLSSRSFAEEGGFKFNLSPLAPLAAELRQRFPPLAESFIVTDGVQTGGLLKTILTQEPGRPDWYTPSLRRGSDIAGRYAEPRWDGWYMLKPERCPRRHAGFHYGPRRAAIFAAAPKIVLRQTAAEIIATLDTRRLASPNSVFHVVSRNGNEEALLALLALLNSPFVSRIYQAEARTEGTTFPQLYLTELNRLPLPAIDGAGGGLRLADLARNALAAAGDPHRLGTIERVIDDLVQTLYGVDRSAAQPVGELAKEPLVRI